MEIRTRRRHWVFILAIALLFLGGCPENYELPQLVDTADAGDTDTDTGVVVPCTETCEGETRYCDEGSGKCVECVESSHCDVPSGHNYAGVCENNVCGISCAEGYQVGPGQDFEQDGCQCATTDLPDLDGIDSNCDGVDGVLGEVVFVSADASPTTDGDAGLTPEKPVPTIQEGIALAQREGISYVLVAQGEYLGKVTLVEGISIYGGYDPSDWGAGRNVDENPTELVPHSSVGLIGGNDNPLSAYHEDENAYKTVVARDIEAPTVLSGLTIYGASANDTSLSSGASTFAVWALHSPGLKIEHGAIVGGNAFDGKDGEKGQNGDESGCTPPQGGAGGAAEPNKFPCNLNENARNANSGERGQPSSEGKMVDGGSGGLHICESTDNAERRKGVVGNEGKAGEKGADGQAAPVNDLGKFEVDGVWKAAEAIPAASGGNGGGGGGGGAQGNFQHDVSAGSANDTDIDVGFAGGRGGNGGCGGRAGEAGRPGGSSFGIAVIGNSIELVEVDVHLGAGGKGGKGAQGGRPGTAQVGQPGDYRDAGAGGPGGAGGWGGAGASGDGGHSVGIALAHGATMVGSGIRFDESKPEAAKGGQRDAGLNIEGGKDGRVENVFPPEQE